MLSLQKTEATNQILSDSSSNRSTYTLSLLFLQGAHLETPEHFKRKPGSGYWKGKKHDEGSQRSRITVQTRFPRLWWLYSRLETWDQDERRLGALLLLISRVIKISDDLTEQARTKQHRRVVHLWSALLQRLLYQWVSYRAQALGSAVKKEFFALETPRKDVISYYTRFFFNYKQIIFKQTTSEGVPIIYYWIDQECQWFFFSSSSLTFQQDN